MSSLAEKVLALTNPTPKVFDLEDAVNVDKTLSDVEDESQHSQNENDDDDDDDEESSDLDENEMGEDELSDTDLEKFKASFKSQISSDVEEGVDEKESAESEGLDKEEEEESGCSGTQFDHPTSCKNNSDLPKGKVLSRKRKRDDQGIPIDVSPPWQNKSCERPAQLLATGNCESDIRISEQQESLFKKVTKLFDFGFEQEGIGVTDEELLSSVKLLHKHENIFLNNTEYKLYLKNYGAIYGKGFEIFGPDFEVDAYDGGKVDFLVGIQNAFELNCTARGLDDESVKYFWAIACYKGDFYFINSSPRGSGNIYSMGHGTRPKRFAKNFLVFLDRVYETVEIHENSDSD